MRIAIEEVKDLRYKLRKVGIPIEGPTNIFCDNEGVVKSSGTVTGKLNKKHNAICYHAVREAAAAGWIRIGWEPTGSNIADIFTKMLNGPDRRKLLNGIFTRNPKRVQF